MEMFDLGGTERAILLFPKVDRIFVDTGLAGELGDRNAGFRAAQDCRNRFGE
ncbi:MAG: hypothetical protein M3R30_00980 [Candidatus Eremiobacteraeota bacterium]|nr:hypothetical protein [Candidatus Eremiobacteraeota bacterium]